ncbi:MAG: hypothetical protein QXH42_02040 [Thermoplasmata archaeon]
MRGAYFIPVACGLFKRKKEAAPTAEEGELEEAIRKKLKDELRAREDAVRERETALKQKEEELSKKEAELALKLQELAGREAKLEARAKELEQAKVAEAPAAPPVPPPQTQEFPPDFDDPALQSELIARIEKRLESAREKYRQLVAQEEKRAEYRARIEGYRARGLSVDRLEAVIGESLDDIQMAFECYENDLAHLATLAQRCDQLDKVFAAEAEALKARCNDPDAIPEIEAGIVELEARAAAKRDELLARIKKWAEQGFSVARFQTITDQSLAALEQAVMHYEEDIEVLRMFGERLASIDPVFVEEINNIRSMLNDPDKIPDIEAQLLQVEQKMNMKKQDFVNKLAGYKAEGWVTDALDAVMTSDIATIEKAFMQFEEDMKKLAVLAERTFKLDRFFTPQITAITDNLRNPARIADIEARIQAIEEETERRRADFRIRIDTLRAEGYDTSPLEEAMSGDLETISNAFAEYEAELARLKELLPRLVALEAEGRHPEELSVLRAKFRSPAARKEVERALAELEERVKAEKLRETEERIRREREEAEKRSREEMERERLERERLEKERLERERLEKESVLVSAASAVSAEPVAARGAPEAPLTMSAGATTELPTQVATPPVPPTAQVVPMPPSPTLEAVAKGSDEETVKALIASAEALIKELAAANVEANQASSHLKLARAFFRSKRLDKALQYAQKAYDNAKALKK